MKKDLTIAGVYIVAIIGAGFASGSEVVYYFAKYGRWGFFGIVLASLLFGVMASLVLELSRENGYNKFSELLDDLFPKRVANIIKWFCYIFMFVVFSAMISGGGETLSAIFNIPKMWGAIGILLPSVIVLIKDIRGFLSVSGLLSVFMVVGILGVCFYILRFREMEAFNVNMGWISSGISYTGYNILTALAILPALRGYARNTKRVGMFSALGIFLMLFSLWVVISIYYRKIPLNSIPMLTICKRQGLWLSMAYFAVLYMAMFTTALANGFALLDEGKTSKGIGVCIIAVFGFFFAGIPFNYFVDVIYRLAGFLGIVFMVKICAKKINLLEKRRKTKKNKV